MNKKLTIKQINELGNLYKRGESTKTLAKKFKVYPSTIHRQLKKLRIRIRSLEEAGNLASIKNRLTNKHIIPKSSLRLNEDKAYILGVLCGDGCLHKTKKDSYQIILQAIDKDFVKEFSRCLYSVYKIKSKIYKIKVKIPKWNDKYQARICAKEAYLDILNYHKSFKQESWRIPKSIEYAPLKIQAQFLKGFFDSEGCVDKRSRRVSANSINLKGLEEIGFLMKNFGIRFKIESRKDKRPNTHIKYNLKIQDKKSLERFNKNISFVINRKKERLYNTINSYKNKTYYKLREMK